MLNYSKQWSVDEILNELKNKGSDAFITEDKKYITKIKAVRNENIFLEYTIIRDRELAQSFF